MTGSRVFLFSAWGTVLEDDTLRGADRPYLPYSQSLAIALITLGCVSVCAVVIGPFVTILAWALALAVALRPLARWLQRHITNQSCASCLVVVVGALMIGLPASWVIRILITASMENIGALIPKTGTTTFFDPSTAPPRLAPFLSWLEESFHLQATLQNMVETATDRLPNILTLTILGIVQFALVLFTTFFFVRDTQAFFSYLTWLSPLPTAATTFVASRVIDTVHACLYGIVLMAILQGSLGAFIFWWLALPQPVLWGIVMGLLAVVPYLGAFVIWIPTAVVLAMHGAWTDAIILSVWGGIVIGLADNFLYPVLVGKRLHYHSLLIFFFLLGGVILFGSAGVVLGPMSLSVTHSLLELWQRREEKAEPHHTGQVPPGPTSARLARPGMEPHAPS